MPNEGGESRPQEVIEPSGSPEPVPHRERREKEEFARALLAATPTVWGTVGLVVINVAVFALMVVLGVSLLEPSGEDLLRFGANYGPLTASGQWWRVLTCTFIHIGVVHLLLNMWGLWQGGLLAERFYGHGSYLALYLASGIGGSLTSLAWSPIIVSAGASGAIFGVYGALLAVVVLHRREIPAAIFQDLRKSTIAVVGYNVFYGLANTGIDNAAHLGGLATGFVVGVCLRCPMPELGSAGAPSQEPVAPARSGLRTRLVRLAPVVVGLGLAAFAAKSRVEAAPEVQSDHHFNGALEAFIGGDEARALAELDAALALQPRDPRCWSLRGDILWTRGEWAGAVGLPGHELPSAQARATVDVQLARECFEKAIAFAPEYAYPHLRLGLMEQGVGNLDAAEAEFKRAIELAPDEAPAYVARGWVRAQSGRPNEALDDYERASALDPSNDEARLQRAHVLRDLGRAPEALTVFQEFAGKDGDDALSSALLAWTIRARAGEREAATAELRARVAAHGGEPRARIGAFLLGELGREAMVLEMSAKGRPLLCEAWFFVGTTALLEGDDELARWAFQKALATRAVDTPLFASVRVESAELER